MAEPNLGQQIGVGIVRNLTAAQLTTENYTFPLSVIVVESDTGAWKIGDGSTAWTSLAYQPVQAAETIAAAGALSVLTPVSKLALVGAGAVTLAAPTAAMLGKLKTIQMTTDNGDVTLALTNVVGQSSGTTATFNDAGDALVVIGGASSKWIVVKEYGISLA
jgi:hypothetical protein